MMVHGFIMASDPGIKSPVSKKPIKVRGYTTLKSHCITPD